MIRNKLDSEFFLIEIEGKDLLLTVKKNNKIILYENTSVKRWNLYFDFVILKNKEKQFFINNNGEVFKELGVDCTFLNDEYYLDKSSLSKEEIDMFETYVDMWDEYDYDYGKLYNKNNELVLEDTLLINYLNNKRIIGKTLDYKFYFINNSKIEKVLEGYEDFSLIKDNNRIKYYLMLKKREENNNRNFLYDENFNIVFKYIYNFREFNNMYILWKYKNICLFLNKNLEVLYERDYLYVFKCKDSIYYFVNKENKCGFIDENANVIIPAIYDKVDKDYELDVIKVYKNGKEEILNI